MASPCMENLVFDNDIEVGERPRAPKMRRRIPEVLSMLEGFGPDEYKEKGALTQETTCDVFRVCHSSGSPN